MRTDRLPGWGWCAGHDKHMSKRPKHHAVFYEYLQMHRSDYYRDCIIIDVDSEVSREDLIAAGIPEPATYTGRRGPDDTADFNESGHSVRPHLVWQLKCPVRLPMKKLNKKQMASAEKQERFYHHVRGMLIAKLEGIGLKIDAQEHKITKNPASEHWFTQIGDLREWSLGDLKRELGDVPRLETNSDIPRYMRRGHSPFAFVSKGFREDIAALGRACMLFETIRHYGYAYKAQASSENDLFDYVLEQCIKFDADNNKHKPLEYSRIRSVAKSIAKWTWRNYTGARSNKDEGACHRAGLISASMTKKVRQGVGGKYGASKNAQKNREAVLEALHKLRESGEPLVISKLAANLEMSRNTVKKYLPQDALESAKSIGGRPSKNPVKTVPIRVRKDEREKEAQVFMYGLPGPGSETWAILPNGTPIPKIWYSGLNLDLETLPEAPADILKITRKRLPISMKHLQGLEKVMLVEPPEKVPQESRNLIIEDNFPDKLGNPTVSSLDNIEVPSFLC